MYYHYLKIVFFLEVVIQMAPDYRFLVLDIKIIKQED